MSEGNKTGLVTALIVAVGTITASLIGFCTKVVPEGALGRTDLVAPAARAATGSEQGVPATRNQSAQDAEPIATRTEVRTEVPAIVAPSPPRSDAMPILRCRFTDAPQTVFNVMADNRIVLLPPDGPVLARREADPSNQFAWIYATALGPRYGVDARGIVWGVHPYTGAPWQIGLCQ